MNKLELLQHVDPGFLVLQILGTQTACTCMVCAVPKSDAFPGTGEAHGQEVSIFLAAPGSGLGIKDVGLRC